jgi:hypothetical protein
VVVECDQLRRLFRLLNPNAKVPGADTIHNDIIASFNDKSIKIQEILQVFILFFIYLISITIKY